MKKFNWYRPNNNRGDPDLPFLSRSQKQVLTDSQKVALRVFEAALIHVLAIHEEGLTLENLKGKVNDVFANRKRTKAFPPGKGSRSLTYCFKTLSGMNHHLALFK